MKEMDAVLTEDLITRRLERGQQVDVWDLRGQGLMLRDLAGKVPWSRWLFGGPTLDREGSSEGEVVMWFEMTVPDATLMIRIPSTFRTASQYAYLLLDDGFTQLPIFAEDIEPGLISHVNGLARLRGES